MLFFVLFFWTSVLGGVCSFPLYLTLLPQVYGNLSFPRLRMAHDDIFSHPKILNVFNFIWMLISQNHQHSNQRIQAVLYTITVHNIVHKHQRTQYVASSKDIIHVSTQSFLREFKLLYIQKDFIHDIIHSTRQYLVLFREFKCQKT